MRAPAWPVPGAREQGIIERHYSKEIRTGRSRMTSQSPAPTGRHLQLVRSVDEAPSLAPLVPLEVLDEQARAYVDAAVAANTRRAYAADWRAFTSWCADRGLTALPAGP